MSECALCRKLGMYCGVHRIKKWEAARVSELKGKNYQDEIDMFHWKCRYEEVLAMEKKIAAQRDELQRRVERAVEMLDYFCDCDADHCAACRALLILRGKEREEETDESPDT